MVGDVIAVMDTLGLMKTHYWGYSMGAHTGLGMAKHFPERLLIPGDRRDHCRCRLK